MLGPFSIDTPFPAFALIQHEFGVGQEATQQLVSTYMIAFAVMSIFHGPLSDALGRRTVMIGGLVVYAVASAGAALAPSFALLLVCRVLQGLAAGGGVIVSRAVVRDLYDGAEAQRLMSRIVMIFGLAPAIAPVVGGWLVTFGSWRAIFWMLVAIAALLIALVVLVLPESHPVERRTPLQVKEILGGLAEVSKSGAFHRVAFAGSVAFGGYFLYIGAAAIVVVDLLHRGATDFWMLFVPMIAGMVCGSFISGRAAGRISMLRLVTGGLGVAFVAAVVNVILASVPATATLPYAVIGPSLLGLGIGSVYPSMQLAVLDMFPRHRGAAASGAAFITLILNAIGAGLLAPFFTRSLATMAWAALAYVVVGSALWAWHVTAVRRSRRIVAAVQPG
ncbi:multidrug effflux MFS transporter [Calidifontibacter sp. DB0510]|uniref:Multidrug effflux MFS transporter n=2 Tax=Metallococcus carri TaxID=1656884 RepID=A0A967B1E8_9MICO|nr:multidrug effflux MFS transporter [Metallococcus carri]NOP39102.1 multidrug effflux MFS transporter [Calidifontibacter sp. DB2511S]